MTLTFKLDLDSLKTNQHAKYIGPRVVEFKSYYPETLTHVRPIARPGLLRNSTYGETHINRMYQPPGHP